MQSKSGATLRLVDIKQPFTVEKLFAIYDCFYVCFDEPNRFENWEQIQRVVPGVKKVEGVVGFDQALKTCAKLSRTPYFFLIDGDNKLLSQRLSHTFEVPGLKDDWVISWSSLNSLNGLNYGNGGLKLWPKEVALQIRSHENAEKNQDQTDYCFIADYYLVDNFMSETQVNKTPVQAFRAGFREGVKMSLERGRQQLLTRDDFEKRLAFHNRERLKIWCEIGLDQPFGAWAVWGARSGLYHNLIQGFDYQLINSYEWIDRYFLQKLGHWNLSFSKIHLLPYSVPEELQLEIQALGDSINKNFPLDLHLKSAAQCREFKDGFQNPPRGGLLR